MQFHEGRSAIAAYQAPMSKAPAVAPTGTTMTWDFATLPPQRATRLSAGPAHDLNSMLTAILGFVQLGRMRENDAAGVQEELDAIDVAARRAVHLVRELVIAEHRMNAESGVADPNEVIGDLLPLLRSLVNPCEIVLELEANAPRASVPRDALTRVVFNLVLNAREAMPDGGRIRISTKQTAASGSNGTKVAAGLALYVSDNGIGMDAATLSRIFEPNFTTKAPGRGNGLGLVTVRDILQNAGGRVTVTTDPGSGTTFLVHFTAPPRVTPRSSSTQEDLR